MNALDTGRLSNYYDEWNEPFPVCTMMEDSGYAPIIDPESFVIVAWQEAGNLKAPRIPHSQAIVWYLEFQSTPMEWVPDIRKKRGQDFAHGAMKGYAMARERSENPDMVRGIRYGVDRWIRENR